jgi:signal transduction histidine kinase
VNNFAKLSVGLVDELKEEIDRSKDKKEEPDYGYVEEILGDIQTNVTKIGEHGSRADNIVKSMLEHSRMDSGEFTTSDLNKLIDESLNLSYHGIKTNFTDFDAELATAYDAALKPCKLNPQALSQVFINMFNNSFYAMQKQTLVGGDAYKPRIDVMTEDGDANMKIIIRDNGTGMPEEVVKKVFEPFFTTKPTGEGTGLGMSISFDIISQMHRGGMTVSSKVGEFTEFIITLPKNLE